MQGLNPHHPTTERTKTADKSITKTQGYSNLHIGLTNTEGNQNSVHKREGDLLKMMQSQQDINKTSDTQYKMMMIDSEENDKVPDFKRMEAVAKVTNQLEGTLLKPASPEDSPNIRIPQLSPESRSALQSGALVNGRLDHKYHKNGSNLKI